MMSAGALPGAMCGEPDERSGAPAGPGRAFRAFLDDGRYLLTFPTRPTRRGTILTASVVGATGILLTRDEAILDWIGDHRSETSGDLERVFEPIGRIGSGFAITGSAWLLGRAAGRDRLRRTSAVAFESFIYTAAITSAAKGLFARERPDGSGSKGQFWEGGTSFPSGHTSRTFAIASVFAESYGPRAAWVAYPIAGLVGLARMENDTHWASDVLAGAGLGIAIGRALAGRHGLDAGRVAPPPDGDPRAAAAARRARRPVSFVVSADGKGLFVRIAPGRAGPGGDRL